MNANDIYHADVSRVSNSMLSLLKQSPRLFYQRYELGQTQKATKAMELGSLLHTMVLEPQEVTERFAVMPDVDRRTKEGKMIAAMFYEQAKGKTVITSDDFANAAIMANHNQYHRLQCPMAWRCKQPTEQPKPRTLSLHIPSEPT